MQITDERKHVWWVRLLATMYPTILLIVSPAIVIAATRRAFDTNHISSFNNLSYNILLIFITMSVVYPFVCAAIFFVLKRFQYPTPGYFQFITIGMALVPIACLMIVFALWGGRSKLVASQSHVDANYHVILGADSREFWFWLYECNPHNRNCIKVYSWTVFDPQVLNGHNVRLFTEASTDNLLICFFSDGYENLIENPVHRESSVQWDYTGERCN
ncbi:MAG: hypothetical protein AAF787_10710 [Chloroflexota bacterium]